MHQLLQLIKKYRAFLIFLILEFFCFWLIVNKNIYQNTAYLNSSNSVVASITSTSNNVKEFVHLKQTNNELQKENALLRKELQEFLQSKKYISNEKLPDIVAKQYNYTPAKIVNNSFRMSKNHMTIDVGTENGIKEGMGVISKDGVVGIVKSCSRHFSSVISLLHTEIKISSEIKDKSAFGTITWSGENYEIAKLKYLPRHEKIKKGDIVQTSGYNTIFPQGIEIGKVEAFDIKNESAFFDVDVKLSSDFTSLQYVYVITNYLKKEKIQLEYAR